MGDNWISTTSTERFPERNAGIRHLRAQGWTYQRIGDIYGISPQAVYHVVHPDKHYAHVKRRYDRLYGVDEAFTENHRKSGGNWRRNRRAALQTEGGE